MKNNRADAKDKLEKHKEAIEDYNKALAIQPNYPEVYVNRGYAKLTMNIPDEAIADYIKALEMYPNFGLSPDFYLYRSKAYEKKGDFVNSKQDLDVANELKKQ